MTTMDKEFWNDRDDSFENSNNRTTDSGIGRGEYNLDTDEDDQNLSDDDRNGRDLDVEGRDEWDADNVNGKDLDEDDLEDNDEANFELHQVKNDQFGSLGRSITNEAAPDPDEIPEEHELGNEEVDFPDGDDTLEQGERNEVNYNEPTEVNPPESSEAPERKAATLGDLDSTFTDDNHSRSTGRTIDHEPGGGSTPPEHGAYNL